MSKVVKGNVVDALLNKEVDIIAHVVNCQGVMGSGVAKEIKERIPQVFNEYSAIPGYRLGDFLYINGVFNLFAQDRYGREKRHLNYGALAQALSYMESELFDMRLDKSPKWKVGIPHKMGCGRAGGDWEVVQEMIEHLLKDEAEVIYYKL